jgi:hypothetical protein
MRGKSKKIVPKTKWKKVHFFYALLKFFFPVIGLISVADMRVTPTLPQRGRQPKGGSS